MLKEIFDHIPLFSPSKKNVVLNQNLSWIMKTSKRCHLNIANWERDTKSKNHPDTWTFWCSWKKLLRWTLLTVLVFRYTGVAVSARPWQAIYLYLVVSVKAPASHPAGDLQSFPISSRCHWTVGPLGPVNLNFFTGPENIHQTQSMAYSYLVRPKIKTDKKISGL